MHRVECIYIGRFIYTHVTNKIGESRESKGKKTCMLIPGPGVAHTYIYVAGPGSTNVTRSCYVLWWLSVPAAVPAVAVQSAMRRAVVGRNCSLSYLILSTPYQLVVPALLTLGTGCKHICYLPDQSAMHPHT